MKTIWKYEIGFEPTTLRLPIDAEFRCAAVQGQTVMLWFELESDNETIDRTFRIFGTGWEIPEAYPGRPYEYIATVHAPPFVWHIFVE
jgi:hypothetical protein